MGQQKKTITVESNDPVNPKTSLYVSAFVEIQFGFEGYNLDFGRIRKGDSATKTTFLVLKDPAKTRALQIESKSPYVSVKRISSTNADNGRIQIEVTLSPEMPAGILNEIITASLSDNSHPASTLRISGTVVGNVEIKPETVQFMIDTTKAAADQPVQEVRVTSTRNDANLQILGVQDISGRVTFEVETVAAGHEYKIKARPNEKALEGTRTVSGEIRISTNDTDQPVLTCRYTIIFPR